MPTTPVRFIIPQRCKWCNGLRTVTPETTIEHGVVRLMWCCRACGREWAITRGEQRDADTRSDRAQ